MPRIVVVEDDASMSQAIERILRAGGFEAVMFASAEAALEDEFTASAACLVLDIQLPGMSGLDLWRHLASDGAVPPVVFITARDEPAVREEAERLAPDSFLAKPFSRRALLDAVAHAIGID